MHAEDVRVTVREALDADAARIAALAHQLGYAVSEAHARSTLALRAEEYEIFVAVVPRAGVVGWTAVRISQTLTSERRAQIEGLVVEDEYRGSGIGAALLARAERWAAERGCAALRLFSNVIRERAHGFYERHGYSVVKTEHLFQKQL